jgi:hypothetical protein
MASRSNIEGARLDGNLLMSKNKYGVVVQTLTATYVMDDDMPPIQVLDPGGAGREVDLPAEAKGLWFYIVNNDGGAAETLTVKEDAGVTTIGLVETGTMAFFVCDGTTWYDLSVPTEVSILTDYTGTAAELNMAADESANTEVVTTTNVILAAESGSTFILDSATAFVTTLPAKAAGLRFNFYAGATQVTGGNHTIVPNASDDNTIFGQATVAGLVVLATVEGSINWVADTILPGDWIQLFNDGTNWYVTGQVQVSGGVTFTT